MTSHRRPGFPPPFDIYDVPPDLVETYAETVRAALLEVGAPIRPSTKWGVVGSKAHADTNTRAANIARLRLGLPLWPDTATRWAAYAALPRDER